jgi:hypothetical protein
MRASAIFNMGQKDDPNQIIEERPSIECDSASKTLNNTIDILKRDSLGNIFQRPTLLNPLTFSDN